MLTKPTSEPRATRAPRQTRVVHLSSVHPAHDNRILLKECRSLARAGYHVELVVADSSPVECEGVHIVRLKRRRSRLGRMLLTTVEVALVGLSRRADIYHFHDPELLPVGWLLRAFGKRVIYDVHEDVPRDIRYNKEWIPSWLRMIAAFAAAAVEQTVSRVLSAVVAATPTIAQRFPSHRTVLVQNFPRSSELAAASMDSVLPRHSVFYVGGLTVTRGAVEMVRAMGHIQQHPEMRLVLAGEMDPPELLRQLTALPGWQRTDYLGWQDRAAVRKQLSAARVGLVLLHPIESYMWSQPIKLFEYMSAGIPVITSDFPLWRKWVADTGCGLCVPPHNTVAIAAAIEWMFDHPAEADEMGRRGRELVLSSLNWDQEEARLLGLYKRLGGQPWPTARSTASL